MHRAVKPRLILRSFSTQSPSRLSHPSPATYPSIPSTPIDDSLPPVNVGQSLKLTPEVLSVYRARLAAHVASTPCPRWRYKGPENTTWRHAGVCIPLVNLAKDGGEPSVLLTVRSSTLRRNGGEVAFPGGSQDPGDRTIVDTALRETEEEVGIPADSVDVLGVFHPLPDRSHTILIHPVLCHVPSLQSLSDLACNPEEVSEAFTVPLAQLLCMGTHVERLRGGPRNVRNWHVDGRKIWGLSAWILEGVLKEVIAPGGVMGCDVWSHKQATGHSARASESNI